VGCGDVWVGGDMLFQGYVGSWGVMRGCVGGCWQDEGWIFAQTFYGITTYYQMNANGSVRVKLEGHLQGCQAFDMVRTHRIRSHRNTREWFMMWVA
jgi:hypothetical protein